MTSWRSPLGSSPTSSGLLERRLVGEAGADGGHPPLDLVDRHLLEAEAVDLVKLQPLLDQLVEHPAAEDGGGLPGLRRLEPEPDDPLDVGAEDRIVVHHGEHPVLERLWAAAGGGRGSGGGRRLRGRFCTLERVLAGYARRRGSPPGGGRRASGAGEPVFMPPCWRRPAFGKTPCTMPGLLLIVATPIGDLDDLSPRAAPPSSRPTWWPEGLPALRPAALPPGDKEAARLLPRAQRAPAPPPPARRAGEGKRSRWRATPAPPSSPTPLVLVREAVAAGARVEPIPGPAAPVAALVASGLPPYPFTFAGFPPPKTGKRRTFYAAGPARPLADPLRVPPPPAGEPRRRPRRAGRPPRRRRPRADQLRGEMLRGALSTLLAELSGRPSIKGELVVVIGGAGEPASRPARTAERGDAE